MDGTLAAPWKSGASAPCLSEVEWAAVAATYLTLSFRARRRRARNLLFPAFEMDRVERTLLSAALDLTFLPCATKKWMERWQSRKRAALQRPALSEVEWAAVAATYLTLSFRARRRRARNLLFPAFEMDHVERTLLSAALDLTFLPYATRRWSPHSPNLFRANSSTFSNTSSSLIEVESIPPASSAATSGDAALVRSR